MLIRRYRNAIEKPKMKQANKKVNTVNALIVFALN